MPNPIDQVIAKGTGLAQEIKARMDGLVGVFKAAAEQHGEAGALLKRAKADESKRAELWPTIRAALKSHEEAELREVYPVLSQFPSLQPFVSRHDAEASQLSQTIDRMSALSPTSREFAVLLDQLIGLVEAHVEQEETNIFPTSQNVISEARAKEIEPKFLATASDIKRRETPITKH